MGKWSNLTRMFKDGLKPPTSLYFFILLGISFLGGGCQDEGRWSTRFPSILSWAEVIVDQWPLASQDLEFFIISDFRTKKSAVPFLGDMFGGFPQQVSITQSSTCIAFRDFGVHLGRVGVQDQSTWWTCETGKKFSVFYHVFLMWIIWEMANNLVDILKHIPIPCTLLGCLMYFGMVVYTYCIKRKNINISFMSITFTYLEHGIAV